MLKNLEVNHRQLLLDKPQIMAVINLTPDSFYDGGKYQGIKEIIGDAESKIKQGAAILDLGAVSTRPGAPEVPEAEELRRLLEPLDSLRKEFPGTFISVDTYRSKVAEACIAGGADMINDISGGTMDAEMFGVIAKHRVPYVLMHMQGTPQTMQQAPHYTDVVKEVGQFFDAQVKKLRTLGLSQLILDPGFGFGKLAEHNYSLLKSLDAFRAFGLPLLAGVSRKSMINQVIHSLPESALNGTTVLNTIALMNGANLLRVHDVKEARQAIELVSFYRQVP